MTKEIKINVIKRIKDKFVTLNDFRDKEVKDWLNDLIAREVIRVSEKRNYLEISDVSYNMILNDKELPAIKVKKVKNKVVVINYFKRDSLKRKIEFDKEYKIRYCFQGAVFIHYTNFDIKKDIELQVKEFITPLLIAEVKDREMIILEHKGYIKNQVVSEVQKLSHSSSKNSLYYH